MKRLALLLSLLAAWPLTTLTQTPFAAAQSTRLSGTITNDGNDDPYAPTKRELRQDEFEIEEQLEEPFRPDPTAKLDDAKAKFQEYIKLNEKYMDAVQEASLPADADTRQQRSQAARKAGDAAHKAFQEFNKALAEFGKAFGLAHRKQDIAQDKARRAGANRPIDQGGTPTANPSGGGTDTGTPSGRPSGTGSGTGTPSGGGTPSGDSSGGGNPSGGGGMPSGGGPGGNTSGGNIPGGTSSGGGSGSSGSGSGNPQQSSGSPNRPTRPRPSTTQPGGKPNGSYTGADINQADPTLQRIAGFLQAYDDAQKADLTGNVLTAPLQLLGGKIKTVGRFLQLMGKAGAIEQIVQDINTPVDPNETPLQQGQRLGKLFYDGLQVRDALKSTGGIDGHGAGHNEYETANSTGRNTGGSGGGTPTAGNTGSNTGGTGTGGSSGTGGAGGPPAPPPPPPSPGFPGQPRRTYPGDNGPAAGTSPIPKLPDIPGCTPELKAEYLKGQTQVRSNYKLDPSNADSPWNPAKVAEKYTNPNTGKAYTQSLADKIGQFNAGVGGYGQMAKRIDLRNKTPQQIYNELVAKGFRHVRQDLPVQKPLPTPPTRPDPQLDMTVTHDIYWHPDGSIVRVKPEGWPTARRPQPHAVKSVLFDPGVIDPVTGMPDLGWGNEAFKVTNDGFALPANCAPDKAFRDVSWMTPAEEWGYGDELMSYVHTDLPLPTGSSGAP